MSRPPSIFNDVIGPVMRGPSSSHCAASVRIGRIARSLMGGEITDVLIEFDKNGSLATTHKSQGSDMGLFGGLLGWDATDERLVESERYIAESGINIELKIADTGAIHPNTYKLILKNRVKEHSLIAISTGGGSIQIVAIDDFTTNISGDIFTSLIFSEKNIPALKSYLFENIVYDGIFFHESKKKVLVEIKSTRAISKNTRDIFHKKFPQMNLINIDPVFPVISKSDIDVPFINCEEMNFYNKSRNLELWELAVKYESERGSLSEEEVFYKMKNIINILDNAVKLGIKGTLYSDRILGFQSGQYINKMELQPGWLPDHRSFQGYSEEPLMQPSELVYWFHP